MHSLSNAFCSVKAKGLLRVRYTFPLFAEAYSTAGKILLWFED